MAEQEKEKKSVLGLALPENANDPSAWRPSKATRRTESGLSLTGGVTEKPKPPKPRGDASSAFTENHEDTADAAAWRPSRVNEKRLSSLSPSHGRRRFAMSPRKRPLLTVVLFACAAYFFVKVWLMPQAGELHVALAIAAAAMVLLFVSAILGVARRRHQGKRSDDQSILRL